jgi:hypothetical protein
MPTPNEHSQHDFKLLLELFPLKARKLVEREAKRRGCTPSVLLSRQAERYDRDADCRQRTDQQLTKILTKILERKIAGSDWTGLMPRAPLDSILMSLLIARQSEKSFGFNEGWRAARDVSSDDAGEN